MRGEDFATPIEAGLRMGSPPHARGRCFSAPSKRKMAWITPACAGKTPHAPITAAGMEDHPRMRGEDVRGELARRTELGSPPHARGRPVFV